MNFGHFHPISVSQCPAAPVGSFSPASFLTFMFGFCLCIEFTYGNLQQHGQLSATTLLKKVILAPRSPSAASSGAQGVGRGWSCRALLCADKHSCSVQAKSRLEGHASQRSHPPTSTFFLLPPGRPRPGQDDLGIQPLSLAF